MDDDFWLIWYNLESVATLKSLVNVINEFCSDFEILIWFFDIKSTVTYWSCLAFVVNVVILAFSNIFTNFKLIYLKESLAPRPAKAGLP